MLSFLSVALAVVAVSAGTFPSCEYKRKWHDAKQGRDVWFDCRAPTPAHANAWWFSPPDDTNKVMHDCLHESHCDTALEHGFWGWSNNEYSWSPTLDWAGTDTWAHANEADEWNPNSGSGHSDSDHSWSRTEPDHDAPNAGSSAPPGCAGSHGAPTHSWGRGGA